MDFKQVLKNRVSVRSYNGKLVTQEQIDEILVEMRRAPTARHLEAYKVKVSAGDRAFVEKIGEATGQVDRMKGCGAVFVFFAASAPDDRKYGEKSLNLFPVQDATLACAYAQLAATNLGLSTLWMGAFDDGKLMKICGIANGKNGVGNIGCVGNISSEKEGVAKLKPSSILVIGHSDEKPSLSSRKDLKEILLD